MTQNTGTDTEVHKAIAKALIDHGVNTIFGLLGDANLFMADSFVRDHSGLFVAATHEGNAVLMALGHASVTGRVGVATVTHGPALSNCATALIEGTKATLPMVLLSGDTAVADEENAQDIPQRELVLATGAGFEQMRCPATAVMDLAATFRRAAVERRPIVLNMPRDFMWQMTRDQTELRPASTAPVATSDGPDLDNAVGIIAAARRPVVLAGRGAVQGRAALISLARRMGAPLATTLKANGLFRGTTFDMGVFGTLSTPAAAEIIADSDCIVSFGAGLNRFTTVNGAWLEGKRLVQVDADRSAIGRTRQPDAGLVGDPGLVAQTLLHWLDEAEIASSQFTDTLDAEALAAPAPVGPAPASKEGTVDLTSALVRLDAAVPANRTFVTDGGRFMGEAWYRCSAPGPDGFVYTVNTGSIGMGMGHAIGAGYARRDRPVLLVTGDGGFMQGGLNEFTTAVTGGLDLIVIICNDQAYGAEYVQFTDRQMNPSLSQFDWPGFAGLADALGGQGVSVTSEADLDHAIAAIAARQRPLIIDLRLDPSTVPRLRF